MRLEDVLLESIDPTKALVYVKNIDVIETAREQINDVSQIDSQSFTYNGYTYVILSFVKNGSMEFHFFEDDGKSFITAKRTFKHGRSDIIFSTVLKYIIERVSKKHPASVTIIGELDRVKLYSLFVKKTLNKYLPLYSLFNESEFNNPDSNNELLYRWVMKAKGNSLLERLKKGSS